MLRFLRTLGYTTVGSVCALGWQDAERQHEAGATAGGRRAGPAPGDGDPRKAAVPRAGGGTERLPGTDEAVDDRPERSLALRVPILDGAWTTVA